MSDRKFTPPTEFPAEYVTRDGRKAVIVARTPGYIYPFVGWFEISGGPTKSSSWTEGGEAFRSREDDADLFDIVLEPQKQVHWANDYCVGPFGHWWSTRNDADIYARDGRIAVIRREWVEGQPPQYFTENV